MLAKKNFLLPGEKDFLLFVQKLKIFQCFAKNPSSRLGFKRSGQAGADFSFSEKAGLGQTPAVKSGT